MLGLGVGNDFGHQNETYFNVSQGWRPVRYFDVASPFSNVQSGRRARSVEIVVVGSGRPRHAGQGPVLRRQPVLDRLQEPHRDDRHLAIESVLQNSGDTRHRGFEGESPTTCSRARNNGLHLEAVRQCQLARRQIHPAAISPTGSATRRPSRPSVTAKYGVSLRRDGRYKLSLTGATVSSQYFQDSDLPVGSPASANYIPAKVPGLHRARSRRRLAAHPQRPPARRHLQPHRQALLQSRLPERHRAGLRRKVYAGSCAWPLTGARLGLRAWARATRTTISTRRLARSRLRPRHRASMSSS